MVAKAIIAEAPVTNIMDRDFRKTAKASANNKMPKPLKSTCPGSHRPKAAGKNNPRAKSREILTGAIPAPPDQPAEAI